MILSTTTQVPTSSIDVIVIMLLMLSQNITFAIFDMTNAIVLSLLETWWWKLISCTVLLGIQTCIICFNGIVSSWVCFDLDGAFKGVNRKESKTHKDLQEIDSV